MSSARAEKVRCRQITSEDLEAVAALLAQGFPRRTKAYWVRALRSLQSFDTPDGYEKFGYMLEASGGPVGAILVLSSQPSSGQDAVRCNVSSWYVRPEYRAYGTLLSSRVLRHASATYVNIDPDPPTWPTIEAQGFRPYADGVFASVPILSFGSDSANVLQYTSSETTSLNIEDRKILQDHLNYGCISLVVRSQNSDYPFVFRKRRFRFPLPCAELVYCRSRDDFVRFARPLGLFLAGRGMVWVMVSASSAIAGLTGVYRHHKLPIYFKGRSAPRLGDLAYTEVAVFGL